VKPTWWHTRAWRGPERSDNSGPWIRRMVGHAAGGSFQATSTRLPKRAKRSRRERHTKQGSKTILDKARWMASSIKVRMMKERWGKSNQKERARLSQF